MLDQAEKSIATMTHSDSPAWFCPRPCNRGSMCTCLDGSRRRSLFHPWDDCQWQRRDKFETVLLRVRPFCSRQFPGHKKSFFQAQSYLLPPSHRPLPLLLSIFYSPHPECSTFSDSFPNIFLLSFKYGGTSNDFNDNPPAASFRLEFAYVLCGLHHLLIFQQSIFSRQILTAHTVLSKIFTNI